MQNSLSQILRHLMGVRYIALVGALSPLVASANPVGGTVLQGSAIFITAGSRFTVTASDRAYINWQSFNIGLGQTTTFVQPSASSVVWNQINDVNPSQILGNLNANGYVILQNSAGFFVGGQASINAHGLLMTTAPIPMSDLASGGAWQFSALPPTAKIVNYGQVNISGGGSAFLIAHDIENHGSITAPGGNIGLYAGREILISSRPDGRGLSAAVTLPEGSVDNAGNVVADGGTIAMHAQVVNQGGLVQANSVRSVNGIVELFASDAINLGVESKISAQGDSAGLSSGGVITIKSDQNFSDHRTSLVNVAGGTQGGNGGQLEISAANLGVIQSSINARAITGFRSGGLSIDPTTITLNAAKENEYNNLISGSGVSSFDVIADFIALTTSWTTPNTLLNLNLKANNNITFSTLWTLTDPGAAASLNLTAGNNIIFNTGSGLRAGNNWSLDLSSGPKNLAAKPVTARTAGIYLDGTAFIETQNGNIKLWAANEVIINSGAIRTIQGGNIDVTTQFGNINSGLNINGFDFYNFDEDLLYYTVSPNLGGISTAAGGNVNISAGGDAISYLPVQSDSRSRADAGSGAFGSEPGNVTVTAGGKVSGHYVVANGAGSITANGGNVGAPKQQLSSACALSLIKGSWEVFAPNGSIYLQEVRNPNGIFNNKGNSAASSWHYFDYDPLASVFLRAANSVQITGGGPRTTGDAIPILLPPMFRMVAGSGGVALGDNVILFPSPYQDLSITTLNGGDFLGNNFYLSMSDSAKQRWARGAGVFIPTGTDHAPVPPELNNPTPVAISVSGTINNAAFYTTKATRIKVGGDIINSSFLGQNLRSSDVTSIEVAGKIYNTPSLNFVGLPAPLTGAIDNLPAKWDAVFELAVDSSVLAGLNFSKLTTTTALKDEIKALNCLLFPSTGDLGGNPGFIYDSSTLQLGFNGNMAKLSSKQIDALKSGKFTVLILDKNGNPVMLDKVGNEVTDLRAAVSLKTKTYTFIDPTVLDPADPSKTAVSTLIDNLYAASLKVPATPARGYQIGGPGQFNISAAAMELGNTPGILSWGIGNGNTLAGLDYASLAGITGPGASINVKVAGDLSMLTSRIASLYGGGVSIASTGGSIDLGSQTFYITSDSIIAYGVFTSGKSDISVTAHNNVNINGSRIAAYDGGNVFVESLYGNVNVGSGGNAYVNVPLVRVGQNTVNIPIYGSGIVAVSLPDSQRSLGAELPGNIMVKTPQGDIVSSQAGILQLALSGSVAGGPTISLEAGTLASDGNPGYAGNINLGNSGLIGGTVNVKAQGNVSGLFISRQDSNISAAQSFSGTLLSAGNASVSAGGSVGGTVIGVGGASVSGTVTADVLGQNVSVNGGASASTLGSQATATATSQSAANQASSDAKQQVASNDAGADDEKNKKGRGPKLTKSTGRVTVILPKT